MHRLSKSALWKSVKNLAGGCSWDVRWLNLLNISMASTLDHFPLQNTHALRSQQARHSSRSRTWQVVDYHAVHLWMIFEPRYDCVPTAFSGHYGHKCGTVVWVSTCKWDVYGMIAIALLHSCFLLLCYKSGMAIALPALQPEPAMSISGSSDDSMQSESNLFCKMACLCAVFQTSMHVC